MGLIAGVIGLVLAAVYIETSVGIITAVLGGFFVGLGLYWFGVEMLLVVLGILGVTVLGAAVQMVGLREENERKRARQMGLPPPPPP